MRRRTSLVSACIAAFAALAFSPASALSTYGAWDGSNYIYPFGCDNTATYGQVITVKGKTTLNNFAFSWATYNDTTGSMVVRAEVYAWDGTKATGNALWESQPRTISYSDSAFHTERFKPGALPLTKHTQYVLFASFSKDFGSCTNNYNLKWGLVDDSAYPNGTFVYQNNGGDASQWTTEPWETTYGSDLAFKAALR